MIRVTMEKPAEPYRIKAALGAIDCAMNDPHCRHVTKLILAGHSAGARVAAVLTTDLLGEKEQCSQRTPVGCLLFSYPLHAPGNTNNLKEAEVLALSVPTLIIHGEGEAASHVVCTPYGSCELRHTHVKVQKRK